MICWAVILLKNSISYTHVRSLSYITLHRPYCCLFTQFQSLSLSLSSSAWLWHPNWIIFYSYVTWKHIRKTQRFSNHNFRSNLPPSSWYSLDFPPLLTRLREAFDTSLHLFLICHALSFTLKHIAIRAENQGFCCRNHCTTRLVSLSSEWFTWRGRRNCFQTWYHSFSFHFGQKGKCSSLNKY